MGVHFIIMLIIVVLVIWRQLYYFFKCKKSRSVFSAIFPDRIEDVWTINRNGDIQILYNNEQNIISKIEQLSKEKNTLENDLQGLIEEQKKVDLEISKIPTDDELYFDDYSEKQEKKKSLRKKITQCNKKIGDLDSEISNLNLQLRTCQESNRNTINTRNVIINSINQYLYKNKDSVTDFNIIKDIVDRNSDAKEEEIMTLNPIPLYLGLVGTMAGIIVGVFVLLFSGALANMMSSFDPYTIPGYPDVPDSMIETARKAYESTATSGVKALLEGVGIAMISSIIGIGLTTRSSVKTKDVKSEVEIKKHNFLSWMQAELLPKISSDVSNSLVKLGKDLNKFNSTFSDNAKLLQDTIDSVSEATTEQAELLNTIQRLNVTRISEANISIYENLKNCSVELRSIGNNMQQIKNGVKEVGEELLEQIDEYDNRKSYIEDASSKVDIATNKAQEQLATAIKESFDKYKEMVDNFYIESQKIVKESSESYFKEIDNINQAITTNLTNIKNIEEELRNLSDVKESIASLERTASKQCDKLDKLAQSITALANVKSNVSGETAFSREKSIPVWVKYTSFAMGGSAWLLLVLWAILTILK